MKNALRRFITAFTLSLFWLCLQQKPQINFRSSTTSFFLQVSTKFGMPSSCNLSNGEHCPKMVKNTLFSFSSNSASLLIFQDLFFQMYTSISSTFSCMVFPSSEVTRHLTGLKVKVSVLHICIIFFRFEHHILCFDVMVTICHMISNIYMLLHQMFIAALCSPCFCSRSLMYCILLR